MVMGSTQGIDAIPAEGEVYTCPVCGYTDGFHVSFRMKAAGGEGEVILICPSCHRRFSIGMGVRLDTVVPE